MSYGMTKEQLIAANAVLIRAVEIKENRIAELEAELMRAAQMLDATIHAKADAEARVRELEAELAKERLANRLLRSPVYGGAEAGMTDLAQKTVEIAERAKARAEKAEKEAKVHILDGMTQRARAEKAEEDLMNCNYDYQHDTNELRGQVESESKRRYALEARVAELEAKAREETLIAGLSPEQRDWYELLVEKDARRMKACEREESK